jgi:DNA-binding response OmpR family regulator
VRALLRRSQASRGDGGSTTTETETGLRIDTDARRVTYGPAEVALTAKEFDVLALLAASRDKVVSREQLMSEVWDENWFGSTKTLDVTIGRLRNKLEEAGADDRVVAIRGVGFRLESGS